jgi:putative DNA primase/helicase
MLTNKIIYPTWETVRAHARGQWHFVLAAVGIDAKFLHKQHGGCPCCGGKDRFRFDNKGDNGTFFCNNCGSGDGFRLIQLYRSCQPKESLQLVTDALNCKEISTIPRQTYVTISPESDQKLIQAKQEQLQKTWNEAKEITPGDSVHTYLTVTRKLPLCEIPAVLRIHPGLPYYSEDKKYLGTYPTMLGKVGTVNDELVSLHRTYLTNEGYKAPVPKPKKLMTAIYEGATKGAAIRLYTASETLILGEGIETSICGALSLGLPAWACVTALGLETVRLPGSVQKVIVLVDNDESKAGQQAAEKLTIRMIREGRRIKRLMPEQLGKDWLDILTHEI